MQPAQQQAPAQTDLGEGQPAPQRMTEVENALSVLQREAGLTEDTLKVLRKAVSDNLQPRNVPGPESEGDGRKRPFKPSSSKRQQLTAEEATEVSARPPCPRPCCGPAFSVSNSLPRAPRRLPWPSVSRTDPQRRALASMVVAGRSTNCVPSRARVGRCGAGACYIAKPWHRSTA